MKIILGRRFPIVLVMSDYFPIQDSSTISEELFKEILSSSLEKRFDDIEALSEEQQTSLLALLTKKDVFAILPTGYGKSLIFQIIPDLCRELFLRGFPYPRNAIVVVICPLRSLVDSHIRELERYGLRATSLNSSDLDEAAIRRGEYSFVFGSPESFFENEKWRNMLLNKEYQSRLFAFVTDEAHVIPKWGFGKDQIAAFRKCFSRIGELRSVGPQGTPMLALTATAKLETQMAVVKSLSLKKDFCKVYVSPYRKNIYLAKLQVSTDKLKTFAWIVEKLKSEKNTMDRTIVYCKSIKDCGKLFSLFKSELGDDSYFPQGCKKESQNLLFGMYHHNTLEKHKDRIFNSFHDKEGVCRLVFATNALGMGINFPNVRTVVNFGPPREVEELVQEIGRAGRDGQHALAVVLYHGRHLRKCEDSIIEYCRNSNVCLRKHLALQFEEVKELIFECGTHNCCVNCHQKCDCEENCQAAIPCFAGNTSNAQKMERKRKVSVEDKTLLKELLMDHKDQQQTGLVTYLNPECTAGFSNSLVKAVLKHCDSIFTLDDIESRLPVFKRSHAIDIMYMFHEVFEDIDVNEMELVKVDDACPRKDYDLTYGHFYMDQSSDTSSEEDDE